MPYQKSALLMLVNQIAHYFINFDKINVINITLSFISGLMWVVILVRDNANKSLQKYDALFWYTTLIFSLLIIPFFSLYISGFKINYIISGLLSLALLSVIVNWVMFLILLYLGLILSYICFIDFTGDSQISYEGMMWSIYSLLFITALVIFFSKSNQENEDNRIKIARSLGGIITHELKTPLIKISIISNKLKKDILTLDNKTKQDFINNFNYITNTIEMIGYKLQGADIITDFEHASSDLLLMDIIKVYPFNSLEDKKLIELNLKDKWSLNVDKILFYHMIFNLLNNAIFYLKNKKNGKITITTQVGVSNNIIFIEDNGPGILPGLEDKIFRSYYTTKKYGTGLGLFFCKQVMQKHSGNIICESNYGKYTKFILYFPKL